MRILIADDDPISRRVLENTLRKLGHEVTAVADGTAARGALLDADGPRLAILDWMMPGLDGLSVCRAVRERQAPYVYIILLTSRGGREDMVAGLAAQADDFLTKPFDQTELHARIQSGARVLDLQSSLIAARNALQHEATHDQLTGLWNRGMVIDHAARECARAQRTGTPVTVAMADLDHFKSINDSYGHETGDEVLRTVAARLKAAVRKTDAVGRYGGEEFLFVLAADNARSLPAAIERLWLAASAAPIPTSHGQLNVTMSIGAATLLGGRQDVKTLIASADAALYRAKRAGRNCVCFAETAGKEAGDQSLMTPRLSA